jgi:hypothetical protein
MGEHWCRLKARYAPSGRRGIALVSALLALGLAVGAGGYVIGAHGGEDLDAARAAGAEQGRQEGKRDGTLSGNASGFRKGWLTGIRKTYRHAYRDAYRDEVEQAGIDPPREIDVP